MQSKTRPSSASLIRTALIAGLVALGSTLTVACNTMEGAGKDIKAAGEKVEDSAQKANH